MNGLALVAALAVAQAVQTPVAGDRSPESRPADVAAAAAEKLPEAAAEPSPRPAPRRREPASADQVATPAVPEPLPRRAAPPPAVVPAAPTPPRSPAPAPTARLLPPAPAPTARLLPEREDAERAARLFLDALARGDADALAQAASERFSFDGDVEAGREPIRRTWRNLLASRPRPDAAPRVGSIEVLSTVDAMARFGKPPARIAPLVRPGALVAVADIGGRTVVLFLAREGGRMAVLGMHD